MKHSHRLPLSGNLRTEKVKQLEEAFSKIHGETKQTLTRKIDYFKSKKEYSDYIKIISINPESAIEYLGYFKDTKSYRLKLRNECNYILKENIGDFLSLACFGSDEKEEMEELIKKINPLVEKYKKEK